MMPQLNPASYFSQAFWLLVSFCLLWALVSIFITPKLTEIIERRKRKINDYIQRAEKLNNSAKETLAHYDEIMAKAQEKAQKDLLSGKQNIKMMLDKTQQKMNAELSAEIADYQKELANEKKQTAKQIEEISQEIALTIVKKLGFSNISAQDIAIAARQEKEDG